MTTSIYMSVFKENARTVPQKKRYVEITFLFFDICTAILLEAVDRKGMTSEAEVNLYYTIVTSFLRTGKGSWFL